MANEIDSPVAPKVPAASAKKVAAKVDLSKYAAGSHRAAVQANLDAGVYDRGEGDLEVDLASLPLADS